MPRPSRPQGPSEPLLRPGELCGQIQRAIDAIEQVLGQGIIAEQGEPEGYSRTYRQKLGILRALMDMQDPVLTPELEPRAQLGHAVPAVDEGLDLPPGEGLLVLEDLAAHGLLARELHNKVHACPECHTWSLNFRETCPMCGSIDHDLERMIHHFTCAYSGLESEFRDDFELVCPKCRKRLRQLGQDFERPHDTYVCHASDHLFDEPFIEAQCLACGAVHPGDELSLVPIHRYRPTPLTARAVELNRLTGLDVAEIMYDVDLKLHTRDFMDLQVKRELLRLRRYGGALTTATLSFESDQGEIHPIFRDWPTTDLRDIGTMFVNNLRELDLVARLDDSRLGILLLEADEAGSARPRERLLSRLEEFSFQTATGRGLVPVWRQHVWADQDVPDEDVMRFLDGEEVE